MEKPDANRVVIAGWSISVVLSAMAPLMARMTGVHESGRWAIYACVAVMVLVLVVAVRDQRLLLLPVAMSASAATIGATVGFLLLGFMGRSIGFVLALKWALGSIPLAWLFARDLRLLREVASEPSGDKHNFKTRYGFSTPDELRAQLQELPIEEREERFRKMLGDLEEQRAEIEESARRLRANTWKPAIAAIVLAIVGLLLLNLGSHQ